LKSFNARSPLVVIGHWQFVVDEQGLHASALLVLAHTSPTGDQFGFDVKQI
jgi:hypothetical protein